MPNQVMLNDFMKYPVDWETSLLGNVVDINPETIETGTPGTFHFKYIDISSVNLGNISWDTVTNQVLSSAPSRARRVARSEDVLFSTVRPGLQSHAYAEWPMQNYYICSTGFAILRAKRMHPRFLYHLIFSDEVSSQVRKLEIGSNYPAINESDVSTLCVPIPPGAEQRRIAEILDTIDEAIQKTEALISKLKAMKQGLLHDLLTRGLDKNGKLRDPKAHPEQFKDSPLGRIPHIWNIMAFRDVLAGIIDFRGKTPLKIGMKWGGGDIPALSANNVEMGQINLTKETYYGSKELYQRWMTAGNPVKGDVLMTLEAPLGNVAQIPDDRPYILSQRVVLFKTKDELMHNTFFRYQLTYEPFQCILLSESTGTTAKGIQRAKLEKLLVLVPPRYNEQELIVSKLEAIDTRIGTEEQYRDKLKLQKKGLMHDLLTGKVRVKV